jgi:hypothetical protein
MNVTNTIVGWLKATPCRRVGRFTGIIAVASFVSACSDPAPANPAPPKGTAELRFSATSSVRKNSALVDPLKVYVYGELYLSEDVSLTGPRDGSPAFASIEFMIDLEVADPSESVWKSEPLDLNRYVFLGMLDVDGNKVENDGPDPGDPVTLPITNQFDVTENQETSVTALFELVYN